MKKQILFLFCLFSLMVSGKTPEKAIYELIDRITPGYARQFRLEIIDPEEGSDVYEIDRRGNKLFCGATMLFRWPRPIIGI